MKYLLPFLLQTVACRIHKLGGYAMLVSGSHCSLPITQYLLPEVFGIAAVDRLYALKPKNPIWGWDYFFSLIDSARILYISAGLSIQIREWRISSLHGKSLDSRRVAWQSNLMEVSTSHIETASLWSQWRQRWSTSAAAGHQLHYFIYYSLVLVARLEQGGRTMSCWY